MSLDQDKTSGKTDQIDNTLMFAIFKQKFYSRSYFKAHYREIVRKAVINLA